MLLPLCFYSSVCKSMTRKFLFHHEKRKSNYCPPEIQIIYIIILYENWFLTMHPLTILWREKHCSSHLFSHSSFSDEKEGHDKAIAFSLKIPRLEVLEVVQMRKFFFLLLDSNSFSISIHAGNKNSTAIMGNSEE